MQQAELNKRILMFFLNRRKTNTVHLDMFVVLCIAPLVERGACNGRIVDSIPGDHPYVKCMG